VPFTKSGYFFPGSDDASVWCLLELRKAFSELWSVTLNEGSVFGFQDGCNVAHMLGYGGFRRQA
jgi:hypothetical protein